MQIIKLKGIRLEAVYACLPDIEIDNLKACQALYGDDAENIVKSTGIIKKYIVTKGISSLDLCVSAADNLLQDLPYLKNEIGTVICVTFTPDQLMPANAIAAQSRLGLANDCLAFDINLACSGYGYALWLAATTAKQTGKKVLILDGDVQSVFTSPYDKSTMPVLSDAGTATIVENTNHDEEWIFTFFTDGSKRDVLSIKAGGSKLPTTQDDLYYNDYQDGSKRRNIDITMDGFEIFRFVAQTVSKYLSDFLDLVGIAPQEIDAFIPHQANMYMIKQLAKKIGINTEKVWLSGDKYGNSASATIPVTIASEYPGKLGSANKIKVLLSGFGAGLSISAAIISMDSEIRCRIFKYNGEQ